MSTLRFVLPLLACTLFGAEPGGRPYLNEIRIQRHVAIPMRDGVKLYADLYLPAQPGNYPTIVTRTPYGVQRDGVHQEMVPFAQRGYAVVRVDVRGRYESEGLWNPFHDEAKDGYDIVEWAAAQAFSNGKIGTQGGSYLGHNQWATLTLRPPHLVAAFPALASTNIYANWISMGGAFRLSFNYGWGVVRMPNRIMLPQYWHTESYMPEELKYEKILRHLPLKEGDLQSAGGVVPHYREWLAHESYDAYWKALSDEERIDQTSVPVHTSGGWFDIFLQGTINGYMGARNKASTPAARSAARMIIGPWGHGPTQKFGEVDFGPAAVVEQFQTELRFFDLHLKGIQNGLEKEDPVKIFYMGANEWRHEKDWPIPGAEYRPLYLNSNKQLSFSKPAAAAVDGYRYDPMNPVPTTSGNNCCGTPTPSGPRDQRAVEQRGDLLSYTSDFLSSPLRIAGPVQMKLHAATDGLDTDWMIKLVDVYPNGFAFPVSEGILRAKFREGLERPKLLTPNQIYEYTIEMTGTANVFLPGHRIRVDITSSNFPQFDRNPNTGEPLGASAKTRVAQQSIHMGANRLSHIVLPVVTRP